jgi:hypothetical protein
MHISHLITHFLLYLQNHIVDQKISEFGGKGGGERFQSFKQKKAWHINYFGFLLQVMHFNDLDRICLDGTAS